MHEAEVVVDVPFFDVDAMEVVWHGHYVKYLELARCKLLDQIDYNYKQMAESGYMWPVVDMRIKYVASATFGSKVTVRARLVEWQNCLKFDYVITENESGNRLTKATTTQVAVDMKTGEMCYQTPDILLHKLEALE